MELVGIFIVLVLGYTWLVYPALVLVWAKPSRRSATATNLSEVARPLRRTGMTPDSTPATPIMILFAAHNEEEVIENRLRNLDEICAGRPRTGIWVGDDGSEDATGAIVEKWCATHGQVHLVKTTRRSGKTAMLKRLVAASGAPDDSILVFTDANTRFAPDALEKLLAHFSDPKTGGVCGRLVFISGAGNSSPENAYWRLETRLKLAESALDSCLGANGAIYAIRVALFWRAIPDSTIVDDLVIGMKVRACGYRMVYEHDAIAMEELPQIADEWGRRVRIGAGDYQALMLCRGMLAPGYGWFAWSFWSHKVLRWFTPHLLIALLAVSAAIFIRTPAGDWRAYLAGWGWGMGVAGTALAAICRRAPGLPGVASRAWLHFLTMQTALFFGFIRFCKGGLRGTWERTERTEVRGQSSEARDQRAEGRTKGGEHGN